VRSLSQVDGSAAYNCCWSSSAQSFSGPSLAGHMIKFYYLRFATSPTWRASSPHLYPPGSGSSLHPQALGSLFAASYDSQGYGGGILTRLHVGIARQSESELIYDWLLTANQFVLATSLLRFTNRDFIFFFLQLSLCGHRPYAISSLTRGLTYLL
jgi:hypothetical protein